MPLALEAFDDAGAPTSQHGKPPDYLRGFEEGIAAGEEAVQSDQAVLNAELVQAISDSMFSFDEARLHVLESLSPLIDVMLTRLLPATLTTGLISQLHEIIMKAADTDVTRPAIMRLHPDQIETVARALGDIDHPHLTLAADPGCTLNAATVTTLHGETTLDLDHALTQIAEVFSALPTQTQRTAT